MNKEGKMRSKLLGTLLLFLAASFCVKAQVQESAPQEQKQETAVEKNETLKQDISPQVPVKTGTTTDQSQPAYVRPDSKTRFKRYVQSMVGLPALGKTVFGAGFGTWTNEPEEWGENWKGFGRRVASNMGKSFIKSTTQYALEETFKIDSHYYATPKKKFGVRLRNALLSPVVARDKNGKKVFNFPHIIGTYTASIVAAETWYPKRYGFKDGLKSGTYSLGFGAVYSLFKEFVLK
jgi:hypothetical protein